MKTGKCLLASSGITICLMCVLQGQAKWENPVKKLLREGKPVVGLDRHHPEPGRCTSSRSTGF